MTAYLACLVSLAVSWAFVCVRVRVRARMHVRGRGRGRGHVRARVCVRVCVCACACAYGSWLKKKDSFGHGFSYDSPSGGHQKTGDAGVGERLSEREGTRNIHNLNKEHRIVENTK